LRLNPHHGEALALLRRIHDGINEKFYEDEESAPTDLLDEELYGPASQPISQWNVARACRWVKQGMKMPQYVEKFEDEEINGELLLALTDHDLLHDLNVTSNLHRKKLLIAIANIAESPEKNNEALAHEKLDTAASPPGCPDLAWSDLKEALDKVGFDMSFITEERSDMLLDQIFKRYGRDPTPVEEWLDEVGAPSSLAVVFRSHGFTSLEDILDADLQESHLKELGLVGMKLRIRALANLHDMKGRGFRQVDTPNW